MSDSTQLAADLQPPVYLSDYSENDKPWDKHRAESQSLETMLSGSSSEEQINKYVTRLHDCSPKLNFSWNTDTDTGESRLKLRDAHFCRVRHCPVCAWRRSLKSLAKFYKALPEIEEQNPKARWVFLTLTVRNCQINDLRATIQEMNKSWHRLVKRAEFGSVLGWVRTTEVTRAKDGTAHPHFHCLLLVKSSYFTHGYISQARWADLWQSCGKLDYSPIVNVKAVKGGVSSAAPETLKYATKPQDLIDSADWTIEYIKQVHKLRFLAAGGILKSIFVEKENEDLINIEDEGNEETATAESSISFDWKRKIKRYSKSID